MMLLDIMQHILGRELGNGEVPICNIHPSICLILFHLVLLSIYHQQQGRGHDSAHAAALVQPFASSATSAKSGA